MNYLYDSWMFPIQHHSWCRHCTEFDNSLLMCALRVWCCRRRPPTTPPIVGLSIFAWHVIKMRCGSCGHCGHRFSVACARLKKFFTRRYNLFYIFFVNCWKLMTTWPTYARNVAPARLFAWSFCPKKWPQNDHNDPHRKEILSILE